MKIFIIEKKRLNLFPEEFIDLIKLTINTGNEEERSSCYILIKLLMKNGFINSNIIDFISNHVLSNNNKTKYIDVFNWFSGLNINNYKEDILKIIEKCSNENMNREEILIEIAAGEIARVSFELFYQLSTERNQEKVILAKAKTGMVCYQYELKKTVSVPDSLQQILQAK
jgi:hypothetical protein